MGPYHGNTAVECEYDMLQTAVTVIGGTAVVGGVMGGPEAGV